MSLTSGTPAPGRTEALGIIEPLGWDSQFFGRPIGRLRPRPGVFPSRESLPDRSAFDCVYVELPVNALSVLAGWATVGAVLTDIRVDLSIAVGAEPIQEPHVDGIEHVARWSDTDRRAATGLAERLSAWSRFRLDTRLTSYSDELYRRWISLAFTGAHEALVSRGTSGVNGLLTYTLGPIEAVIELLVVDDESRARGIGPSLIQAFLGRARASGCATGRVRTQLRNLSALRAYERAGFTLQAATLVLHWWRE